MPERWHPDDDVLLEVALGTVEGPVIEQVADHVSGCVRCHRRHRVLMDGVDLTVAAVPRSTPPPGFETRVLERLHEERAHTGRPSRSGRQMSRWLPVAAAGIIGLTAGVAAVRAFDSQPENPPSVASAQAAPLVADDGSEIGSITRSQGQDGAQLVVILSEGTPGATYTCRAVLDDGTVRDLARWEASGYADDVWIIDEPASGVRTVELVDEAGEVWAAAAL